MATEIVERDCTIEHNGRTFESGGAVVTDDRIVAYIGKSLAPDMGSAGWRDGQALTIGDWTVTDWHGTEIGRAHQTGAWRTGPWGTRMFSYYVTIYGTPPRHYNARGQGEGMILTGKRAK